MLLFMDGASHYSVTELGQKWTSKTDTNVTWAVAAEGRTDGCVKRTSTGTGDGPGQLGFSPLFNQSGTWTPTASGVFGCALKIDALGRVDPTVGTASSFQMENTFFQAMNGIWTMFGVCINQNGTFSVYRQIAVGGTTTLLATSAEGLDDAEWAYIEIKWTLSTTTGSLIIHSNGNEILNYSGVLYPSAFPFTPPTVTWNSILVLGMKSQGSPFLLARMCDVYLLDQTAPNSDFLGDIRVAYIKPNGVGNSSQWTPSAGANWQCVDEVPPNSDTDYVETTTVGNKDTYAFENVTGDPLAIQVCNYCRKTSAAGASLAVVTRQNGTDYEGPTQGLGSTSYDYVLQPYDTNPDTSAQWTQGQMDAGQWGPLKAV